VNVTNADYTSISKLAPCLAGYDALVSLINRDQADIQILLIDAAIAAGVPHVIPSSFGIDQRIPEVRANPALAAKVRMEDHVAKLADEGAITYTAIQTGMFFDWGLKAGVLVNAKGPTMIFDGGDTPFSVSSLDHIGTAVANALGKPEETRNKILFMHSAVVTQNQLVGYAREVKPDGAWEVIDVDTKVLWDMAMEKYNKGERGPDVMRGFLPRQTLGLGLGVFKEVDNGVLGIQEWDGERVRQVVAECLREI